MDVHIDPYEYTNDIRVNLWLSYAIHFALRYFTQPEVWYIGISLSHTDAHYTGFLVTSFVLLSCWHVPASAWHSRMRLARRWMPSRRENPQNIPPSSEEQIPLMSYLVHCQTFRWTYKLSLWLQCYIWRLSNPTYRKNWLRYSLHLRNQSTC